MTRIASNFKADADDWAITGDVRTFEWQPTGGNGGGYIFWRDVASGEDAYWQAPGKFLGDLSEFRTGKLSFDWYASDNNYQSGDVLVTGANGDTLVADVTNPGTDWTHASVRLSLAGHWHVGSGDGPIATNRQISAVLSDVTRIQIRAEHVDGPETGGLDNFALTSRAGPADPMLAQAFGDDRHGFPQAEGSPPHHPLNATHVMLV